MSIYREPCVRFIRSIKCKYVSKWASTIINFDEKNLHKCQCVLMTQEIAWNKNVKKVHYWLTHKHISWKLVERFLKYIVNMSTYRCEWLNILIYIKDQYISKTENLIFENLIFCTYVIFYFASNQVSFYGSFILKVCTYTAQFKGGRKRER